MSPTPVRRRDSRPRPWSLLAAFLLALFALYLTAFAVSDKGLTPKLGIDLQGGTRVTLIPKGSPSGEDLKQAQEIIRDRVNGLGVAGTDVVVDGSNIVLTVPGEDSSRARDLGTTSKLSIRPVLKQATATGAPAPTPDLKGDKAATEKAVAAARAERQGTDQKTLESTLENFRCPQNDVLAGLDDPAQMLIACGEGAKFVLGPVPVLEGQDPAAPHPVRLDGQQIVKDSVSASFDQQRSQVQVSFRFASGPGDQGSATWAKLTQDSVGKQVSILLDGHVISAPTVNEPTPVGGATSISGSFTMDQAQALASNLRFGALPVSFEDPNVDNVPASLGMASLNAGLLAGLVGLLLVLVYSVLFYRLLGVLAFLSLLASAALSYAVLVLLGVWVSYTLDIAGIAGLIIGIGMTADSYVVFFERVKDELREGHRFRSAVPRAWKSARRTIVSGNTVSFIGAAVLATLAIGEVRGFAFTLGLTTLTDLFVAFTVTWPLVYLASTRPMFAQPWANGMGGMAAAARRGRAENAAAADAGEREDDTDLDPDTNRDTDLAPENDRDGGSAEPADASGTNGKNEA